MSSENIKPSPDPSPSKRRIVPMTQQSMSQRTLAFGASSHPPLTSLAHATDQLQLGYDPDVSGVLDYRLYRRITLPYNLVGANIDRDPELRRFLYSIFPDTLFVMQTLYSLNFTVKTIPPTPWPLTVGGFPITVNDGERGRGLLFPPRLLAGNPGIHIRPDMDGRRQPLSGPQLRVLAADVHAHFEARHTNTSVVAIMFTAERLIYLVLPENAEMPSAANNHTLPGRVAKCLVYYVKESTLGKPLWADEYQAQRVIQPQPDAEIYDDTPYPILRPGVLLRSRAHVDHAHPHHLMTTSGIVVKNVAGDTFITGSAHGIGPDEKVFQQYPAGAVRHIGRAVQEISFTDVAIIQLENGVRYINETFEDGLGQTPRFTRLLGEVPGEDVNELSSVHLNSATTGAMDGVLVAKMVKIKKSQHPTDQNLRFISYIWTYAGQIEDAGPNAPQVPQGTCGTPIWDDEGRILGFFQYQVREGLYAGIMVSASAEALVSAGYTLA